MRIKKFIKTRIIRSDIKFSTYIQALFEIENIPGLYYVNLEFTDWDACKLECPKAKTKRLARLVARYQPEAIHLYVEFATLASNQITDHIHHLWTRGRCGNVHSA